MATQPISNLSTTWNAGATTFTAIKMNVTDTASSASSLLLDLQVGGVSRFNVNKTGTSNFTSSNLPSAGVVTDGNVLFSSTHDGASGPLVNVYHNSPSPADLDSQRFQFWHNNSSATPFRAVILRTQALSVTAGAENATFDIFTVASGSLATRITIGATGTTNFSVAPTAGGVAIPTISSTDTLSNKTLSGVTIADATNIILNTTTGTKIGTSASQKLGFFDKTPVVQPTAVADATTAVDVITQFNALLTRMRNLGLIAT
jgi:hypothetical protein